MINESNQAHPLKVEVHGYEKWLTINWQTRQLAPLTIVSPSFNPDTDFHIFYEWAILDRKIYSNAPLEKRVGLILESSLNRELPAKSISHIENFRIILTYDPFLLSLHPNYRFNPHGMSWSFQENDVYQAPPKSKIISMITSDLSDLPGHKLRVSIAKQLYNGKYQVDIYGRNIPWGPFIPDRRDGVAPYLFNITIENCNKINYFTEKIVDCFITRTVPIYCGCPNISDYFNPDGILIFKNEPEFWSHYKSIISSPYEIYQKHLPALEENFLIALDKFNVKGAWESVAKTLMKEREVNYNPYVLSIEKRISLYLMQKKYLFKEHGLKSVISSIIKD